MAKYRRAHHLCPCQVRRCCCLEKLHRVTSATLTRVFIFSETFSDSPSWIPSPDSFSWSPLVLQV